MGRWTTEDMPALAGRVAVVTGTGGIGLEVARALAAEGCNVIIAGRDPAKGARAVEAIGGPGYVCFEALDLASLDSVARFAERMLRDRPRLDLLLNNAGVMAPPVRRVTPDGHELQFGTNHLGHVALTARLLPALRATPGARVVSMSSLVARRASIDLEDLDSRRSYVPMRAYAQSKLACLMFALELQRRSDRAGWGILSLAAHPGIAATDLFANGMGAASMPARAIRLAGPLLSQSAVAGALPMLLAATALDARLGGYYGPCGFLEMRGRPGLAWIPRAALDEHVAAALWSRSEDMAGVSFGS